jgi:hypothetical protein
MRILFNSSKLATFLSKDFFKYIENTNNLCIYKLGSHRLPNNLFFYKTSTLTLINCSKEGVSNILNPAYFPNLCKINYLSLHPGNTMLYDNFKTPIEWVFPNENYKFYRDMISQNYGYADKTLMAKYIKSFEISDSFSEFDLSINLIINVPDYATISGEFYKKQFYNYLLFKYENENQNENQNKNQKSLQELEDLHLHNEYMRKSLEYYNSY